MVMKKLKLAFFAMLVLTVLPGAAPERTTGNQPPAGFFQEVQVLLNKANGKYGSNPDDVFNTPYKIVAQTFTAEKITVKATDGKKEREWSFTPNWPKSYPFGISDARNSRGKNVKSLRAFHGGSEIEVFFLKKDAEKMQQILDKYSIKD